MSFIFTPNVFAKEINIYSHRQPFLINPFLELFTQETGIKTNVVYSKKGLAQRLKAEGENSPADVILTVDIGRLYIYDDLNLLAPVESQKLNNNIPVYLRSPDNTWFGLSKRARVIVVNKKDLYKFDMFMERLLKANAHEVKIVENFTDAGADNVSDDIVKYAEDTTTLLDKYIDELEIDLDKDRLKNTMRGLYNEAQDLEI